MMYALPIELPTRFWQKVDKQPDGHWTWTAASTTSGHGLFKYGTRWHRAHRLAYQNEFGPISGSTKLTTVCGSRGCVNPHHQEVYSNVSEDIVEYPSISLRPTTWGFDRRVNGLG